MKTKQLIALGLTGAAILAAYGASDRIDVYNKEGKFISILVDDIREITFGRADNGDGYSTFNIATPTGTKSLSIADATEIAYSPVIENKAHDIFIKSDEHAVVRLLDWRNNTDIYGEAQIDPTKPFDWRGCWADGTVHFLVDTEKGYVSEFFVTGSYTGKVYTDNPNFIFWSMKENNLLGMDSYAFDMPYEPVTISTTSYELDTYADAPFLGSYTGYAVLPAANRISHKASPVITIGYNANTTYTFKSTDANAFDVLDLYKWDEDQNIVSFIPYEGEMRNEMSIDVKHGIIGKFFDGDIFIATVHNMLDDKPENNVRYIATKGNIEFTTAAADDYGLDILMQVKAADGSYTRYFYYDDTSRYPAEVSMNWVYGNNIGNDCQAYCVNAAGERIFRYDGRGSKNAPVFTFRGKEYGTYTGQRGNLVLDGFGSCALGSSTGTYSIDGGLLSVVIGSENLAIVIDNTARTYTISISDKWDGQPTYILDTAVGAYNGGEQNSKNKMFISFDVDLMGKSSPGNAAVKFEVTRTDGFSSSITVTQSVGPYIYDAANHTIVITNIYMGTSSTSSGRRNLTMKLSDDKYSMWVDDSTEDRLYSTSRDGSYLLTGQVNTLTAPKPTLAASYTGKPEMVAFGSRREVDQCTLSIDEATSKATFKIVAMSSTLVNATVDYTFDEAGLTLKGVPSCLDTSSLTPTTTPIDLLFTIGAEGKLTATQNIIAVLYGSAIEIDLQSATLEPAE